MNGPLVGLIGIILLIVLMFLKMPIGFNMIFIGFIGFAVLKGISPALVNMWVIPPRLVGSYDMAVLPLFLFMGILIANAGVSRDLYFSAYSWVGQRRGGLAMATVLACAGFAAVCGSSAAEATTMGKVVTPEIKKYKYDLRLAAGAIASGGTLAILIPPSLGLIMYAILTEQSIGRLFIAGIIPGVFVVVLYLIVIYVICRRNPLMGPAGPKTSFREKLLSLRTTWPMLVLFVLVIGGIYGGIFTPTEAGGIGAFGALIIGLVLKRFSRKSLWSSLAEAGELTAMMLILFLGATIFNNFMAASTLPFMLADTIASLQLPTIVILALILLMYFVLGCFFDVITSMVLTLPILFPVVLSLNWDPIWYGILMVRLLEIGLISPPFGLNDFILAGVMKVPIGTIYRGVIPFVIADIISVVLLVAIPQISLFLPNLMMGK